MLETLSLHACHGGTQGVYQHQSSTIGLSMRFSVYLPPQANQRKVPGLFYLAGLTGTEETLPQKAGAQRYASQHGVALIACDTSPRGAGLPDEAASWDFGIGAGFYVNATQQPWAKHYQMYSYVRDELRETVLANFPIDGSRLGVFGHSMGGHGALILALRNPDIYRSVSAFSPIAAPIRSPWGEKAFNGYLGANRDTWAQYDASELLLQSGKTFNDGILIDQGLADRYLHDQLNVDVFEAACRTTGQSLTLRRHEAYDHSYYFVSTFIETHINHHAGVLT